MDRLRDAAGFGGPVALDDEVDHDLDAVARDLKLTEVVDMADQLDRPVGSGLFLGTVVQIVGGLVGAIVATWQERRARRVP